MLSDKSFFDESLNPEISINIADPFERSHRNSIGRNSVSENYPMNLLKADERPYSKGRKRGMSTSNRERSLSLFAIEPQVHRKKSMAERRESIFNRKKSVAVGTLVSNQDASIYFVCNDGKKVLFEDGSAIPESAVIGRGAQGKVYRVEVVDTADKVLRQCALKTLLKSGDAATAFLGHAKISEEQESSFDNNIAYLIAKLTHIEVNSDSDSDCDCGVIETVFALVPLFPLFYDDVIVPLEALHHSNPALALTATTYMLRDLLTALKAINEKGYTHADVKPANIAVSIERSEPRCMLIDMDGALSKTDTVFQFTGTPAYTNPGCFVDNQLCKTLGNDIYSLGVVLKQALGDASAKEWMKHQDMLYETCKLQATKFNVHSEAVKQGKVTQLPDDLTTRLSKIIDVKTKLAHIADTMACFSLASTLADHEALSTGKPTMLDQPSIDELITCTAALIDQLDAENKLAPREALKAFYEEIIEGIALVKSLREDQKESNLVMPRFMTAFRPCMFGRTQELKANTISAALETFTAGLPGCTRQSK